MNAIETKLAIDESKRSQNNAAYVQWYYCTNGIIVQRKEISSFARVELTHGAVSAAENTTKLPAFRPLEKKATTTMLVKRK